MLTDTEKEYIKRLVKKDLQDFKEEEKSIISNMTPLFMKGEIEYEDFLKELLKKLEK